MRSFFSLLKINYCKKLILLNILVFLGFDFSFSQDNQNDKKDSLLQNAINYYKSSEWQKSLSGLERILSSDINCSECYYYKSLILAYYSSSLDSSLYYINKALEKDVKNISYLNHKMNLLFEKGNCEEAFFVKLDVIEYQGLNEQNVLQSADLLYCMGSFQDAIQLLVNYNEEHESLQLIAKIATFYGELGNVQKSICYFEKLVNLDPKNSDNYYDLARFLHTISPLGTSIKIPPSFFLSRHPWGVLVSPNAVTYLGSPF